MVVNRGENHYRHHHQHQYQHQHQHQQEEERNRVFYELCSMIIQILGSPPLPIPFPAIFSPPSSMIPFSSSPNSSQLSPAAFASLLLGISLALMLFGSVIFVIGFILMPWVMALVFLFYLAGLVSSLSHLGRSFLCPPSSLPKAWKFS